MPYTSRGMYFVTKDSTIKICFIGSLKSRGKIDGRGGLLTIVESLQNRGRGRGFEDCLSICGTSRRRRSGLPYRRRGPTLTADTRRWPGADRESGSS